MFKRFFSFFAALIVLFTAIPCFATSEETTEDIPSESNYSYYVYEQETQQVLVQRNSSSEVDASLSSRLMCAIIVLETQVDGHTTSITDKITPIENSKSANGTVKLYSSQSYTVDVLLKAMLLENADNCARALAYSINPNTEYFVSLMNQKAANLGMTNTFFTNMDGTYNQLQRTTVYDMTVLYSYALKNTQIKNILQSEFTHIWNNKAVFNPCTIAFESKSTYNASSAGGLMVTGSGTSESSNCIILNITFSSQDSSSYSMKLIFAFFCESGEDAESFVKTLISDCFENYRKRKIYSVGDTVTSIKVADQDLALVAYSDLYCVVPVDVTNYIHATSYTFINSGSDSSTPTGLEPPITTLQQIGTAHILLGDGSTHDVVLVAGNTIRTQSKTFNTLLSLINNYLPMFIIIGVLLVLELYIGIVKLVHFIRNK